MTVGQFDDSLPLNGIISIAGRPGGPFYAAALPRPTILKFDARGRLSRTLGRSGRGPGEFTYVRSLTLGPGDTLYAFDLMRRVVVFDPSGHAVRTVPVPYVASHAAPMRDGRLVVAAESQQPRDAGLPLHLLTVDGAWVRSFGSNAPVVDPSDRRLSARVIASDRGLGLWAAHLNRYRLERYAPSGDITAVLNRSVEWFPEPGPYHPRPRVGDGHTPRYRMSEPAEPAVRGIHTNTDGSVLVLIAVASTDWKEHEIWLGEGEPMTAEKLNLLYDSVIEHVDPRSGSVLASIRTPVYIDRIIGDRTLASLRTLPDGVTVVDVWEYVPPSSRR